MYAAGHVEEGGFHHDEAFETPVEVGEFFNEAEFGFGGGAEVVDEGVADFLVFGGVFGHEEGVGGGGESVADGGLGGALFAGDGGRAFGFGSVAAGGVDLGGGARGFGGNGFGIHGGSPVVFVSDWRIHRRWWGNERCG